MIGAVIIEDIVDNIIILDESQIEELSGALNAEIIDARPYGLAIGDLRTDAGWTRNAGGEQIILPLLEQEQYDSYTIACERADQAEEIAMSEAVAILEGAITE